MFIRLTGFHFQEEVGKMYMTLSEEAFEKVDIPGFWESVQYEDVLEPIR